VGELQAHLPGIDSAKIITAVGSTDERIFRIWHREDSRTAWNDDKFATRFAALVARLGGSANTTGDAFARLRGAWGTSERRYHGVEHLADCLRELDRATPEAAVADLVELALWYHDAVYDPRRGDSEERSAELLLGQAADLGIPQPTAAMAAELVRATKHTGPTPTVGQAAVDLVRDIDLSILGRDVLRFMEYEHAVAEEHAFMPALAYELGRGRFLASLLAAPSVYRTPHFRERFEDRARSQIGALLRSPRYRGYRWLRWLPTRRS
jgi:predicted metal-dependent HD superfamily phosphohydrolase